MNDETAVGARLAVIGAADSEPLAAPEADPAAALMAAQTQDIKKIRRYLMWIFLFAAFAVVFFARDLFLPIVLAILIALTLSPVVRAMHRVGVPSAVTGITVIALVGALVSFGIYKLGGPVTEMAAQAPEIGRTIRLKFDGLFQSVTAMQEAGDQVAELAGGSGATQQVVVAQTGLLTAAVGSLASVGTSIMAALILAMFILAQGDFFHRRIVEAAPTFKDKKRSLMIVRDVERQVSRYLGAITIINAGLGLAIGIAMWLLDMPMPAVWGAAGFLLNFLPFIGAIAGIFGVAAVSIVTFESVGHALLVPGVYILLTAIEGNIVTPTLVGRRLEVNPVAVLVTVMLWVWLWGIPGAFLAVPFLVVLKVICDKVPDWQTFGSFLSGDLDPAYDA